MEVRRPRLPPRPWTKCGGQAPPPDPRPGTGEGACPPAKCLERGSLFSPRRMKLAPILVSLAIATAALAGTPPTPGTGTFTTIENLEYANAGGKSLQLDLRIPDGAGPFP